MNILIATGLYPPDIGGPATYTVFLEKCLPQYGITYEVLPYGVVRKYPKIIRHMVYFWTLVRRARHVDVLYALDTVSVGLPVLLAHMVTRTPYLLRVPGDYAWEQGSQRYGITETLDEYLVHPRRALQVRILAWIQKRVAKHAHHIIVPSEYMRGVVGQWKIGHERVTRVYTELKEIFVDEGKEVLRKEFQYEGFVLLTAARLVPWKGIDTVIRVVHALKQQGFPITLEIIGDGVLRQSLESQVDELSARAYIRFLGAVSHQEVGRRVKAVDAFVLNTSYEGLSHHLIEAMSLNTPIITTPVGGNVELIEDGVSGMFITYRDEEALAQALIQLMRDRTYGHRLAAEAKKRVGIFHEDVVVKEFITLVRSLWRY